MEPKARVSDKAKFWLGIVVGLFSICGAWQVAMGETKIFGNVMSAPDESWLVIVVFALPIVAAWYLRGRQETVFAVNHSTMLWQVGGYLLLWLLYLARAGRGAGGWLAWGGFICSIAAAGWCFCIVWGSVRGILNEAAGEGANGLGSAIRMDLSFALAEFLGLFMCMTFYLTFMLASWHTLYPESLRIGGEAVVSGRESAAEMVSGDEGDELPEPGRTETGGEREMVARRAAAMEEPRSEGVWKVWFRLGSTELNEAERMVSACGLSKEEPQEHVPATWCERYSRKDCGETLRWCFNTISLREVRAALQGYKRYERVRVTLMGHANEVPPRKSISEAVRAAGGQRDSVDEEQVSFAANYQYAEARVLQVQERISRELEGVRDRASRRQLVNVEWLLVPVGTANTFLKEGGDPEGLQRELSVEIGVQEVRNHLTELAMREYESKGEAPRSLLLYLYFMVYTVTTTGYGDVVPMGAVPRFITILGNLFEVLFIVILMGVVMARCVAPGCRGVVCQYQNRCGGRRGEESGDVDAKEEGEE